MGFEIQHPEPLEDGQQGRHDQQHGHQGKEDTEPGNEAELAEAPEIRNHQYEKRQGRGQRADRDGLTRAREGGLGGIHDRMSFGPLLGVARVEMDAIVDAQAEQHEAQRGRHEVEFPVDHVGQSEGPRQAHEQREPDDERQDGRPGQFRKEDAGPEGAPRPRHVGLVEEVEHHEEEHGHHTRAERVEYILLDGRDFGHLTVESTGGRDLHLGMERGRVGLGNGLVDACIGVLDEGHVGGRFCREETQDHGQAVI